MQMKKPFNAKANLSLGQLRLVPKVGQMGLAKLHKD
jgi:hypothetical protein